MSKCECKECVHEKVCRIREFPSIEEILKDGCPYYKDKSLWFKFPCKIGTPVFFFVEDVDSKVFNGKVISVSYEQNTIWIYCRYDNGLNYHHTIDDIGKTLFFTKEEAEAKLKEMG